MKTAKVRIADCGVIADSSEWRAIAKAAVRNPQLHRNLCPAMRIRNPHPAMGIAICAPQSESATRNPQFESHYVH
jgi:hypothetical protein